jgi:hypothetical protein
MQSKASAGLMLLGTFVLGAITGVVGNSLYRSTVETPTARAASRPRRDIVEDLARDIPLDPDQKEKLRVIIGKTRERFRELHKQTGPQFQAIRDEGWDEIRRFLRDDQKARFETIIRDMDNRMNERRKQGDRGPQPSRN